MRTRQLELKYPSTWGGKRKGAGLGNGAGKVQETHPGGVGAEPAALHPVVAGAPGALAAGIKDRVELRLAEELFSYEPYGLMVRRNDSAMRLAVNRTLAHLYRSGEVLPIFAKWFGVLGAPGPLLRAAYLLNSLPD